MTFLYDIMNSPRGRPVSPFAQLLNEHDKDWNLQVIFMSHSNCEHILRSIITAVQPMILNGMGVFLPYSV